MARIRSIKPAYFKSRSLARVARDARYLFAGLWTYCDDQGRGADDARSIKAEVFPLDDDMTPKAIEGLLQALVKIGVIVRYEADGWRYLAVVNFGEHQRVNKPQPSQLPAPPVTPTGARTTHSGNGAGTGPDEHRTPTGWKGRGEGEGREEEGKGSTHTPRAGAREARDDQPPAPPVDAPDPEPYPEWRTFAATPHADGARPHAELVDEFYATLPTAGLRRALAAIANKALQEGLTHGSLYDALYDWTVKQPGDPGPELWRRYLARAWKSQKAARAEVARQSDRLRGATDADRSQFAEWERQAAEEAEREAATAGAAGEVTHG
jgi:hypothetical protein